MTATDENINPYQPPTSPADGEGDRAPWWPGFANLLALLLTVGLLLGVSFTRRRFDQLFADFETELPVATTIALSPVSLVVAVGLLVAALATAFIPRAHVCRRIDRFGHNTIESALRHAHLPTADGDHHRTELRGLWQL